MLNREIQSDPLKVAKGRVVIRQAPTKSVGPDQPQVSGALQFGINKRIDLRKRSPRRRFDSRRDGTRPFRRNGRAPYRFLQEQDVSNPGLRKLQRLVHASRFDLQVLFEPKEIVLFLLEITLGFCPPIDLKRDQDADNNDDELEEKGAEICSEEMIPKSSKQHLALPFGLRKNFVGRTGPSLAPFRQAADRLLATSAFSDTGSND